MKLASIIAQIIKRKENKQITPAPETLVYFSDTAGQTHALFASVKPGSNSSKFLDTRIYRVKAISERRTNPFLSIMGQDTRFESDDFTFHDEAGNTVNIVDRFRSNGLFFFQKTVAQG